MISGRFRVERLLGRGSMGAVWLARHLALDVDVAVKFIDGAFRDAKDHRSRFVHEAQSAARISSPHVVNVLDFGEDEGRPYIAMEYLVGEDLGSVLERAGRLSPEVTARVISHACRGLAKAHALGIAHRDIKPDNLFLCGDADEDGFVLKILDFGVAKTAASLSGTTAGQLIGSPAYMSPEQARGLPQIDGRSDLFSLGVVAYHCLTGNHPFGGDSLAELLFGIIGGDPVPVSRCVPGLPVELDVWFARALHKDPSKRFPSAKDMSQGFHAALGLHASSGTEHVHARASLSGEDGAHAATVTGAAVRSSSRLSVPQAMKVSASNQTASLGLPPALAQLGELLNVLGVAFVSPELVTLAHHSSAGLGPAIFGEIVAKAHEALVPFENLEATAHQNLGLHFNGGCVVLRFIDRHALICIGGEQVNPAVLNVTMNTVCSKLATLAKQGGGAAAAFRATQSGAQGSMAAMATSIVGPPAAGDVVPDHVLSQVGHLFAKPLGALGRLAFQQRVKAQRPTYGSFVQFVERLASTIEDQGAQRTFRQEALGLVGDVLPDIAPTLPVPAAAPVSAPSQPRQPVAQPGASAPSAPKPPPVPPRPPQPPHAAAASPPAGAAPKAAPGAPAPAAGGAPAKRKRVIIYRGSKMEVDD